MMPIYLLGSRTPSVDMPNQALSVSISGSVDGVAIYIDADDPHDNVVRVNPRAVILPAIGEPGLTVGVEPAGAATFGHDTVVHLTIAPDSPDELDPVQVNFDAINVSGSTATALAALRPHDGWIEVSVRAVADTPLSPLASMARTAARRRAGNCPHPRAGALSIDVDASASMSGAFADGSIGAAIDMIVGVADAVGVGDVGAALVGVRRTPVEAAAPDLAQAVGQPTIRFSAGARWSTLSHEKRTIVVTDAANSAIPEDVATLCISRDARLSATGPVLVPPPDGVAAQQHLAANPALVEEVATALLQVLA